jgi:hypothetical protein
MDITVKETGERHKMDEIALYTIKMVGAPVPVDTR